MKKMMIAALLMVSSTAVFAGDSAGLKAILKAKTYAEAQALVSQSLASLADDAERAKAYNKLVDLALEKYNKESVVQTQNQMNAQLGQKDKDQAVDTEGMYNAVIDALNAAAECDKYDQKPNAKGQVKPRFQQANAQRLLGARVQLVNAGQEAASADKPENVLKYWGTFLDTEDLPLFANTDKSNEKEYLGQVALFTAQYAFQAKDKARASRYCDIAMQDEQQADRALSIKLLVMRDGLTTKADSLAFKGEVEKLYQQKPENDVIIETLAGLYGSLESKDAQTKFLDNVLAKNPTHFVALFLKGQAAIADNDTDGAVNYLRKAVAAQPENPLALTYLGACLNVMASDKATKAEKDEVYKEALQCLDKAKELDPNRDRANWAYNRYQACYGLYGADAPETKAAEAETH